MSYAASNVTRTLRSKVQCFSLTGYEGKENAYQEFHVLSSLIMPRMITRKKGFQWKKPTDPLLFQRTESPLKRSLKTGTKWNISKNFSTRSMPEVRGNEKKNYIGYYALLQLANSHACHLKGFVRVRPSLKVQLKFFKFDVCNPCLCSPS